MKRRTTGIVIAGLVSLSLATGSSAVAGEAVGADVTIKKSQGFAFKGQVTSKKGFCEKSRLVRVFRKQEGADLVIGTDKTDSGGKYRAEVAQFSVNTKYYAEAVEKSTEGIECKAATSPNFEIKV